MQKFIKIHPKDNVAVALESLAAHLELPMSFGTLTLSEDIPQGHKFALCNLPAGAPIVKSWRSNWNCHKRDSGRFLGSHAQYSYKPGSTTDLYL